jgi:hypothetical protein
MKCCTSCELSACCKAAECLQTDAKVHAWGNVICQAEDSEVSWGRFVTWIFAQAYHYTDTHIHTYRIWQHCCIVQAAN